MTLPLATGLSIGIEGRQPARGMYSVRVSGRSGRCHGQTAEPSPPASAVRTSRSTGRHVPAGLAQQAHITDRPAPPGAAAVGAGDQ